GHTMIALVIFGFVFLLRYPSWAWAILIIPVAILWLPQVLFLSSVWGPKVVGGASLVKLNIGWMARSESPFVFWLKNLGLVLPLVAWGIARFRKEWIDVRSLALAAFLIFFLGQIIQFAYWEWDNMKLFIFAYLGFLPMVAILLAELLEAKMLYIKALGV